uniref:Uncharacterized protein n=1 Tax=Anguilla anguilla TaxID=7936 RepID=A0A0E9Q1M8_ANGAN
MTVRFLYCAQRTTLLKKHLTENELPGRGNFKNMQLASLQMQ